MCCSWCQSTVPVYHSCLGAACNPIAVLCSYLAGLLLWTLKLILSDLWTLWSIQTKQRKISAEGCMIGQQVVSIFLANLSTGWHATWHKNTGMWQKSWKCFKMHELQNAIHKSFAWIVLGRRCTLCCCMNHFPTENATQNRIQKWDVLTHNRIGMKFSPTSNVWKTIKLVATRLCLWYRKDHNKGYGSASEWLLLLIN